MVLRAIKSRRSIRDFKERLPIKKEDLQVILEAARWAPSAKNLQTTEYIIVKDDGKKRKLADIACQDQPMRAPVCIVLVGDLKRAALCEKVSYHALTTAERGRDMFIYLDAAAAAQNMLLAATELGLGSLWISSFDDKELVKLLKLPEHYKPIAIMCFGNPLYEDVEVPPRRSLEEVLHLDEWSQKEHDPTLIEYSKKVNTPKYQTFSRSR
ncbi:MAG: nitroreductase family protein [Candidatus Altiarchaeales archaeon]|nr:nitroreductase family protein [Candidatus Altiarchaeales archaeon]